MTQTTTQNQPGSTIPPLLSPLIVVIPAYNPTIELHRLIQGMSHHTPQTPIVVVDDGSWGPSKEILSKIERHSTVRVVRHTAHKGKGQALKTGIEYVRDQHPSCTHIVTADADGQHAVLDIVSVANDAQIWKEHLVLGSREFHHDIPTKSWIGNRIIRALFRICTGLDLQDTQTGLRGIPIGFGLHCLALAPTGYDFEMAMLIECRALNMSIRELTIQAIYIEGNRYSHFNPLSDSLKICHVIILSALDSCKKAVRQATDPLTLRFSAPLITPRTHDHRNTPPYPKRKVEIKNEMKDGG